MTPGSQPPPRILVFAGSSREGSYNRILAAGAARFAREAGGEVTQAELGDFPMPLMNEDLEASGGIPEAALAFKRLLMGSDGFLIASPEYNGFVTPLLKNALDWASRSETPDEKPLLAFRGKTAGIVSASPGSLGGLRSLSALRVLLGNLGVLVIPRQHAVPAAHEVFGEDGGFPGGSHASGVRRVAEDLVSITRALGGGCR